jgi:hypothetical protein
LTKIKQWKPAVFLNDLAFSLGLYHQSTHMDQKMTEINNFIAKLDKELDHVVVLQHLIESLVLWKWQHFLIVPELSLSEFICTVAMLST